MLIAHNLLHTSDCSLENEVRSCKIIVGKTNKNDNLIKIISTLNFISPMEQE